MFLWDVARGRIVRKLSGHTQRVNSVSFSDDASVLASASYDRTVRLWDVRSSERFPIQILGDAKDSVTSVQILGKEILTGSVDGFVRVYDARQARMISDSLQEPVTSVHFTGDSNCILASCLDSAIRLVDKSNGATLNTYRGHVNKDYRIFNTFTHTDAHIVAGSEDGKVYFYDFVTAKAVQILSGHTATVSCIAYHPKAARCLSASFDGTIRLWVA